MDHHETEPAREERGAPRREGVALTLAADELSGFFPLLQRGVTVPALVGRTLKEFLCEELHIPADYVTGRITTIFLDNSPVDDLGCAIRQGARLTLSAAMPGLVGATMRRSGFYAALRQGITHAETAGRLKVESGSLRLKLFNLLLPELAPLVLARGVRLEPGELDRLLGELSEPTRIKLASLYPSERDAYGGILLSVVFRDR
jgi:hypothetical protein